MLRAHARLGRLDGARGHRGRQMQELALTAALADELRQPAQLASVAVAQGMRDLLRRAIRRGGASFISRTRGSEAVTQRGGK